MIIVGAGMAGLIAGHIFPSATIIERDPEPKEGSHRALLRFRSDSISLITGIPFRKVTVRKGIWTDGRFVAPSIKLANFYARKVTGRYVDRSIWDLEPVSRYIAPEDFYTRSLANLRSRVLFDIDIKDAIQGSKARGIAAIPPRMPIISTMPLHIAADTWLLGTAAPPIAFDHAPISVRRWRIESADVFQTVYFPSSSTSTYRASITGSLLIVESMNEEEALPLDEVLRPFGIDDAAEVSPLGAARQTYGKIAPIDDRWRRELIHRLSTEASVYSVGRFATWRNILLDDVVKDLRIVKSLIEMNDAYHTRISHALEAT